MVLCSPFAQQQLIAGISCWFSGKAYLTCLNIRTINDTLHRTASFACAAAHWSIFSATCYTCGEVCCLPALLPVTSSFSWMAILKLRQWCAVVRVRSNQVRLYFMPREQRSLQGAQMRSSSRWPFAQWNLIPVHLLQHFKFNVEYMLLSPVVPNRWVATPKWVAEESLWGREQLPQ